MWLEGRITRNSFHSQGESPKISFNRLEQSYLNKTKSYIFSLTFYMCIRFDIMNLLPACAFTNVVETIKILALHSIHFFCCSIWQLHTSSTQQWLQLIISSPFFLSIFLLFSSTHSDSWIIPPQRWKKFVSSVIWWNNALNYAILEKSCLHFTRIHSFLSTILCHFLPWFAFFFRFTL